MFLLRVSMTSAHTVRVSVDGVPRLHVDAEGSGELAIERDDTLNVSCVFEGEPGTRYHARFEVLDLDTPVREFTMTGMIAPSGKTAATEKVVVRQPPVRKNAFPAGVTRGAYDSGRESVKAKADNADYTVFYGTNRARVDEADPSRGYSGERGKRIDYGTCRVFIPKSHKIGSVGSPWWKRLVTFKDDRLKLLEIGATSAETHWQEMSERLAALAEDDREAVVFVHGYNVTFEEAALRAAQIGFDLSIKGAMAFFSWPSQGTLRGYPADEATIDVSEDAIESYLADFAVRSGARRVHLIAHSMGNRGVMRAIHRIASAAHGRTGIPFDQIILAAADVDADKFRSLAAAYTQVAKRTTLYVSEKDRAVEASHWLHRFPRLGFTPPVFVMDKLDTVSVSNIDLTLLGHGYVGAARDVLKDMHELIRHGTPPEKRFGLKEAKTEEGERYWLIGA
ncbi:MAG TPA: alpha/beta fold hydrolase [Thermoanaerobaculia bacterium]|nr:alpha/beta fold hydrolase [Thermoanaerobaculia bacterium]